MTRHLARAATAAVCVIALASVHTPSALAQSARGAYAELQQREQQALQAIDALPPDAPPAARTAAQRLARNVIAAYDNFSNRFRSSGYADNALFNAAGVAEALHLKFERPADRTTALRLYRKMLVEHPTSSLVARATPKISALEASETPFATAPAASPSAPAVAPTPALNSPAARSSAAAPERATLTAIDRTVMPEAVRVTLSLDREVTYRTERLAGPPRVFFDLKGVQTAPDLRDAVLRYPSDLVRQIRVGRHPESTVRVVLDLDGIDNYSVFTLYNPFRLVIDFEPPTAAAASVPPVASPAPTVSTPRAAPPVPSEPPATIPAETAAGRLDTTPPPAPPRRTAVADAAPKRAPEPDTRDSAPAPAASAATTPAPLAAKPITSGGFSLARQLGLGVSRIVIDPGHGGHDPGAHVKGMSEADLTLDIALRLEKLLQEEGGVDVVLTRRTNVYIPLEERTAIANRENADLFLSIHANASRNAAARGVETYFLSFASSPDAEAVAARENSASAGEMRQLPDMIKAIALNNKLDESKDFAGMVQEALVTRLRRANRNLRNLGVKKAPFVVLIGAGMPSVLAEVAFLTNKQEASLLKSAAYKQRIAEALHAAVIRYKRSLKGAAAVAER